MTKPLDSEWVWLEANRLPVLGDKVVSIGIMIEDDGTETVRVLFSRGATVPHPHKTEKAA